MYWLDIVILVALAYPAFNGLKKGLIKAILSLAGLIIGIILAGQFYQQLAELLTFIPDENLTNIAAFVLILVGVMAVATLVARLLDTVVKITLLGWVNHLGGAVFGMVLGAILMSALLATWVKFFGIDTISESFLATALLDKFPLILALLPEEFDTIRDFFQ